MFTKIDSSGGLQEFETGCLGAVVLDHSMLIQDVSEGVLSLSGFDRDYLVGRSALDVVHPDDYERAAEAAIEAMATPGPSQEGMYRLRYADGTFHRFAVQATTIQHEEGPQIVFQFSAVSARLLAEEFASDTVNTLRMLAETQELDDCLERVHRLAERHVMGVDLEVITVEPSHVVHHVRLGRDHFASRITEDEALPDHVQLAYLQDREGPWRRFNRMARFDSNDGRGRITAVLTDDRGDLVGYFVASRAGLTEPTYQEWMVYGLVRQVLTVVLRRVQLDAQLQQAADCDPLTGLVNRRRLFRDMTAAPVLTGTALLLIDLDQFSWFNNTLGHQVGDQALIALADQLIEFAPDNATVARFGGDEFVVWLPGGPDDARALAELIHITPVRPAGVEDLRATVRSSVGGITVAPDESLADAIGRADAAMYVVKDLGGDDSYFA